MLTETLKKCTNVWWKFANGRWLHAPTSISVRFICNAHELILVSCDQFAATEKRCIDTHIKIITIKSVSLHFVENTVLHILTIITKQKT